jgi:hypothetical protein
MATHSILTGEAMRQGARLCSRIGVGAGVNLLLLWSMAFSSAAWAQQPRGPFEGEKWGPFRGQIVDAETGQPIAGAVVLVVWWEAVFTPIQTNRKFYDAREALTDPQGRFEVPRLPSPFFTFRFFRPNVIYFAPGYAAHAELVTPPDGEPFVDPTIVQVRRLKTREERIRNQDRYPPSIPARKMPYLLGALNMERAELGLKPITRGVPEDP